MKKILALLKKFNDVLEKVEIFVGCFALTTFILMTAYQVLSRFTSWQAYFTEEIATTCFIWTAFMGAPVMLRRNEHYRFVGISEKFKGTAFWINEFIVLLILLTCNIIMLVHGIKLAKMFYTWRFGSMFKVSKVWLWLCVPISGFTGVCYVVEQLIAFLLDPSTRKVQNEADKLLEEK